VLLQPLFIRLGPRGGEHFPGKDLFEHEIAVLHNLHFDRHTAGVQHTAHVGCTAAKTPQHTGTGFHVETTHAFLVAPAGARLGSDWDARTVVEQLRKIKDEFLRVERQRTARALPLSYVRWPWEWRV